MTTAWYEIENAAQIPSPTILLYPDRIAENLQRMIANAGDISKLRPHVKTHKLPQVVQMKLDAGITKFKTSTIAEAEMTLDAGGRDILLAYQPVGPNISRVLELQLKFPEALIATLVDNPTTLAEISAAAAAVELDIPLFIDLNVGMNRTGIAPGPAVISLYEQIVNLPGVTAAGLHAYDGHLHETDFDLLQTLAKEAFEPVWTLKSQLEAAGLAVPKIIASGTPTSKLLAQHENVEVGAGTTVLWDAGQGRISPDLDFLNAAVLLARVISQPAADRICIDLGHKSVASEMSHPRVTFFGLEKAPAVGHNEEHLVLQVDRAADYPVGTVLYGLPTHICPTIALHNEVWCVRDGRATETWEVIARKRCLTI